MRRGVTILELLIIVFVIAMVVVPVIVAATAPGKVKVSAEQPTETRDDRLFGFTKTLGGEMRVSVPKGFRLLNVTWKGADMWMLLQSETDGHHEFVEKSNFGLIEAKVIFDDRTTK